MEKFWMKSWPDYLPKECEYPLGEIPVQEYLRMNAKKNPDKNAIIFYGKEISYKELDSASDKFSSYLVRKGIKQGERVGIYMGNCPQYIIAHFGILKMGGIVCPINPLFKEMELKYQINDAEISAVVSIDMNCERLFNIKDQLPSLKQIVYTNFNDYLPEIPVMPLLKYMSVQPQKINGADSFIDIMEKEDDTPVKVDIDMEDLALFEYTGGSSGLPKGAMHSHRGHLFKPLAFSYIRELTVDSLELTPMPYFHIAGMDCMLGDVIAGATNICITQFDPLAIFKAIDHYKATNIYTAVPMNVGMMQHPQIKDYDLSSLKINLTSSFVITLNEEINKQWQAVTKGCSLVEAAYGLSETHTADTFMPKNKVKYGSVGIPLYDTEIKILDPNDRTREVPVGEQGEIAVKTKSLMKGYWKKEDVTAESMLDGFLLTGDIGKYDEDGYLYWLGRLKEMIKVSGHSVFPEEVESLLNQHPDILESAVISVKNEKKGEVVKAFVVIKEDKKGKITEDEIIQWAVKNMAPHKVPVYISFRDDLPKSGVKLLRRILRDEENSKN